MTSMKRPVLTSRMAMRGPSIIHWTCGTVYTSQHEWSLWRAITVAHAATGISAITVEAENKL